MMASGPWKFVNRPKDLQICAAYGVLKSALPNAGLSNGFTSSYASDHGFTKHEISNITRRRSTPEVYIPAGSLDQRHAMDGTAASNELPAKEGCTLPPIANQSTSDARKAGEQARPPRRNSVSSLVNPVPEPEDVQWHREPAPARKKHKSHRNHSAEDDAAAELSRRRSLDLRRQRLVEDPEYMDREIINLRRGKFMTQSMMRSTTRDELYDNACLYTTYATAIRQRRRKELDHYSTSHSVKDLGGGELFGVAWNPAEKSSLVMNRSRSTPTFDVRQPRQYGFAMNKRGGEISSSSTCEVRSLRRQIEGSHKKLQELEGRVEEKEPEYVQDVHAAMRSLFHQKAATYADVGAADSDSQP